MWHARGYQRGFCSAEFFDTWLFLSRLICTSFSSARWKPLTYSGFWTSGKNRADENKGLSWGVVCRQLWSFEEGFPTDRSEIHHLIFMPSESRPFKTCSSFLGAWQTWILVHHCWYFCRSHSVLPCLCPPADVILGPQLPTKHQCYIPGHFQSQSVPQHPVYCLGARKPFGQKTNEHRHQVGPWAEWAGDKDRKTCDCGHPDSVPAPKRAGATHPQLQEEMWVQCWQTCW